MGQEYKRRHIGRPRASRRPRFARAPQHEGGAGAAAPIALIFPLNPRSTIRLQPQRAVALCAASQREPPMLERRKEGRSPSYLGGQITTDRRLIAIDCVVRNTSGAGARLIVPYATLLPDVFELHIPKKNAAYRVRACWRRSGDVGVEIMPLEATD